MSVQTKFNVGDLVFAKMKGYPPWPAKILHVNKKNAKTPSRNSFETYDVYFLGTNQRGTCSKNSIFPYSSDFKNKNGGVDKRKYGKRYSNALKLMEDELFFEKKVEVPAEVKKAIIVKTEPGLGTIDNVNNSVEEIRRVLTRSNSKTCLVVEKKEKKSQKDILQKKILIKLKRIDDIYPELKSKNTITLNPTPEPKIVNKGIIKLKKTEDLIEKVSEFPLKEYRHNSRTIGQELYRTTQGSPFVIQNVCSVDENFFKNDSPIPDFVTTPDPLSISPSEYIKTGLSGLSPLASQLTAFPPMPPLQPKPVHRNQFGSNIVYLQSPPNTINGQKFLIVQPSPPLAPQTLTKVIVPPKKEKRFTIKAVNTQLKSYVAPVKHVDHDYIKRAVLKPATKQKKEAGERDAEEEEKIFQKLRKDIFEPKKKRQRRKKAQDPLDVSKVKKTQVKKRGGNFNLFNPTLYSNLFATSEVTVKSEPKDDEMDFERAVPAEQIVEEKAEYQCTKCKHIFSKYSYERHKCGTLQFDDINSLNIHNTLRNVIKERNWENRKIFFTCSVCKKNCHNVEELADHLSDYHRNKPEIPKDPLALDDEIEPQNEVKSPVLTPVPPQPKNPRSVVKVKSSDRLSIPTTPKKPETISPNTQKSPILVCDKSGKQFLLIPQTEENKGRPLDINKIMSTIPPHLIQRKLVNQTFVLPEAKKKSRSKKVVPKGKAFQNVFMSNDLMGTNSDSSCTLSASEDDDVRYKGRTYASPKGFKNMKPIVIKDLNLEPVMIKNVSLS